MSWYFKLISTGPDNCYQLTAVLCEIRNQIPLQLTLATKPQFPFGVTVPLWHQKSPNSKGNETVQLFPRRSLWDKVRDRIRWCVCVKGGWKHGSYFHSTSAVFLLWTETFIVWDFQPDKPSLQQLIIEKIETKSFLLTEMTRWENTVQFISMLAYFLLCFKMRSHLNAFIPNLF